MKQYLMFGMLGITAVLLSQPAFAQSYTAKRKSTETPVTSAPQPDTTQNSITEQKPVCSKQEMTDIAAYNAMINGHYATVAKMEDELIADYPSIAPYKNSTSKDDRKKPAGRSVSKREIDDIERRSKAINDKNDTFLSSQAYKDAVALHDKCGVKMPKPPHMEKGAFWLFGED